MRGKETRIGATTSTASSTSVHPDQGERNQFNQGIVETGRRWFLAAAGRNSFMPEENFE